jgi:hypothetical protein
MKRTLLFIVFGLVLIAVSAQDQSTKCAPDGSIIKVKPTISPKAVAPDFTTTFTNGTSANLYATLNAGNSVLLDFFFAA